VQSVYLILLFSGRGDLISACKGGFLTMDEALNKESLKKEDSSGCTAVSVIIKGNKIYCVSKYSLLRFHIIGILYHYLHPFLNKRFFKIR